MKPGAVEARRINTGPRENQRGGGHDHMIRRSVLGFAGLSDQRCRRCQAERRHPEEPQRKTVSWPRRRWEHAGQRRCLGREGSGNTQGKGSAFATKAAGTQGKCSVLAAKAVEHTEGTGHVSWPRRQWNTHRAQGSVSRCRWRPRNAPSGRSGTPASALQRPTKELTVQVEHRPCNAKEMTVQAEHWQGCIISLVHQPCGIEEMR